MTVLSAQTIRRLNIITPFCERTVLNGMTFGLSSCGYDVRVAQEINLSSFNPFVLASTIEHFIMPTNVLGRVCDKSSWARLGLAVQNSIMEPGWEGFLTLELSCNSHNRLNIRKGAPIAQIVFDFLDESTESPYCGKYQNQGPNPQRSISE